MIHPGLAALEKWEPIEYAAGYRARLAAIPDSEIAHHCWRCGWEDADTEALELDRHKRVLADGGKMITLRHGACCSMLAAMPGRIEFLSMRVVRNPGKKAGSPRTSMLGWQALKTKPSKTGVQRALHCRCGREKILALGLCATCYTLKRQDDEYFGGLREQVLERDGYCCRVCGASGRRKRSIVVHHRVPGKSELHLMISLCPGCHAKVGRTRVVLSQMPPLLLELWREQHPLGHEQTALDFKASFPVAKSAPLFREAAL
jgi:5-methylcytosine-specific restriction endonuclease McrA